MLLHRRFTYWVVNNILPVSYIYYIYINSSSSSSPLLPLLLLITIIDITIFACMVYTIPDSFLTLPSPAPSCSPENPSKSQWLQDRQLGSFEAIDVAGPLLQQHSPPWCIWRCGKNAANDLKSWISHDMFHCIYIYTLDNTYIRYIIFTCRERDAACLYDDTHFWTHFAYVYIIPMIGIRQWKITRAPQSAAVQMLVRGSLSNVR